MRNVRFATMAGVLLLWAGAAHAGSYITAQELASRLGMRCNSDQTASRCTLSDGTNEVIIWSGMYNLMVNSRLLSMESRAESRGGYVYVPDTVLGSIRGYMRSGGGYRAAPSTALRAAPQPPFDKLRAAPSKVEGPVVASVPTRTTYATASAPAYTPRASSYTPELTVPLPTRTQFTVVIDPGHGGKDPGAIGAGGLREKTVNLGIGLALRDILQFRGARVVMTRQDDTFVELEGRAAICNREQADVYVSIHSNAAATRSTTGSEIYFVDDKGEYTAIARGVTAARTMDVPPWAVAGAPRFDLVTKEILFGSLLEEFRIESRDLASDIMSPLGAHMISYGRGIYGNKGLRVLRFTRCPAVLVEVGFLSNPQTEQILGQEYYRRALADSIAEGVMHFKVGQDQTAKYTR